MKAIKNPLKIANAQAFWGDRIEAASELMVQQPDLDYLTLDYLSEVSLSIMAVQRDKDPNTGYAKDFIEVVKSLIPFWQKGSGVKVITNAGGLDPKKCAAACLEVLKQSNCQFLKIGIVYGDSVEEIIKSDPKNSCFNNLETQETISTILSQLNTANAYLGAKPICEALELGADIVITGRVADPSMTVAPCMFHFGWSWTDYDKIAQVTMAGHLIECGTQVTGGISTDWIEISEVENMGFPFVEINNEAEVVITKPEGTSGRVNIEIVKEQLLYEMGNPGCYLSPDVTVSILSLELKQMGKDRVLMRGSKGQPPPLSYKVSATYRDGFKSEGMLAIFGRECKEKAQRCGNVILSKMNQAGLSPQKSLVECIGCGDLVPGIIPFEDLDNKNAMECLLRISIADTRMEVLEFFTKQIAPLVTSGPPGTTGYTSGRPHIRSVFGYWPCLIETIHVLPKVELIEALNE